MKPISLNALTESAFAPFGDVIHFDRDMDFQINGGMCDRFHDLAKTEVIGEGARIGISLGRARAYDLPLKLSMMERHPLGSQAFIPLQPDPFLVVVAQDDNGQPSNPVAFLTSNQQGVNYHCNVWHAVLTPLEKPGDFIIIDRIGTGNNLEEHHFDEPYLISDN